MNFQPILNDWMKVGTMMVVSRILSGEGLQDPAWQKASLYTLLGFTAYHLFTNKFISTDGLDPMYKPIADDWLKVGTMLIVSRLLSGGSLYDRAWQMSSLYTLLGFTAYNLLTNKMVQGENYSENPAVVSSINDWAKVGTMLIVSRLLSGGDVRDNAWIRSSLGTLLGFTAYNFLSNLNM